MKLPQHVHRIKLLDKQALQAINSLLANAPYVDGKLTATDAAKLVKNNLQVDINDQKVLPQLNQIVGMALMAEPKFNTQLYASRVYPFMYSKCTQGMGYGWHVDSPVMGGNPAIRTDLAMTIFLSEPSAYEGGELVIKTDGGDEYYFKPEAGEAIVYPCQYVHCVNEVKSGTRSVVVTWFQCSVRSAEQRKILSDLKDLHDAMAAKEPNSLQTQQALQTWSNLLRMWAEV